jgi:Domain of unknown function (DUF4399)
MKKDMKKTHYAIASIFLSAALALGFVSSVQAESHYKKEEAIEKVFIVQPLNKAVVTSPFVVKFGLQGKQIGPIGDLDPTLGHHHLIIDVGTVAKDKFIPFDDNHKHFPLGQKETELNLPPGKYKLTLQFGNGAHQSYGVEMSHTIEVEVVPAKQQR